MRATYSPEDNKLRLYPSARLDTETFERVRAAGYSWAPKQELFVAPMWTPGRADLAIELADSGEIEDEDTSLVDRAEQRADRFADYREARSSDAVAAQTAVARLADGIPFGQPILVGHHSEKHARKDAARIGSGMARAAKMWETAAYWKSRAAGALAHAKYVEFPAVRFRRIKGLEADLRKQEKETAQSTKFRDFWAKENLSLKSAQSVANYDHVSIRVEGEGAKFESVYSLLDRLERGDPMPRAATGEEITLALIIARAIKAHDNGNEHRARWITHINNRLVYERAMLGEAGGVVSDKFAIIVGGQVLYRDAWRTVKKVNRANGRINSVSVVVVGDRWAPRVISIEDVKNYKPPEEGAIEAVKAISKRPPLVNYDTPGAIHVTQAEWTRRMKDSGTSGTSTNAATETHGVYRQRVTIRGGRQVEVFVTDAKIVERPALDTIKQAARSVALAKVAPVAAPRVVPAPRPVATIETSERTAAAAIREQLKAGVHVVTAPQLFPTPMPLARRMVELADIQPGQTVLEPSAGTGNIVRAVIDAVDTEIVGYEINAALCSRLASTFPSYKLQARCRDFLEVEDGRGQWERIVMNPPFKDAQDIAHILHALSLLKAGGRLVAICADGPRQNAKLKPLVDACGGTWEQLPAGTFDGTNVQSVLLSLTA